MSRIFPNDDQSWLDALDTRWPGLRRRSGPIALTLSIEIVLLLMLLSLGTIGSQDAPGGRSITTFVSAFDLSPEPEPEPQPAQATSAQAAQARPQRTPLTPPPVIQPRALTAPPIAEPDAPPNPAPGPAPDPAPSKIRAVIRSDMAGNRGPVDTGTPGDSQRIAGSGPDGEPLYAAQWYREPTDDEFRGYFSRVSGPGWALIDCRTEPEFRVDHCVLVDEWPERSNMGSAVLAATWQFRVRPPRVGGRSMVGEWVRIRIDYAINRQ